jgi:hypothetical protein
LSLLFLLTTGTPTLVLDEEEEEDDLEKEFERELEKRKLQTSLSNLDKLSDQGAKVKIQVKFPDGTQHKFRIGVVRNYFFLLLTRQEDPFSKLFDTLAKNQPGKKLILQFDGESLSPADTPQDLDMEDGDLIDARFA